MVVTIESHCLKPRNLTNEFINPYWREGTRQRFAVSFAAAKRAILSTAQKDAP